MRSPQISGTARRGWLLPWPSHPGCLSLGLLPLAGWVGPASSVAPGRLAVRRLPTVTMPESRNARESCCRLSCMDTSGSSDHLMSKLLLLLPPPPLLEGCKCRTQPPQLSLLEDSSSSLTVSPEVCASATPSGNRISWCNATETLRRSTPKGPLPGDSPAGASGCPTISSRNAIEIRRCCRLRGPFGGSRSLAGAAAPEHPSPTVGGAAGNVGWALLPPHRVSPGEPPKWAWQLCVWPTIGS
mmetsp:Transcript_102520/g.330826  ORF Transcript_102520/g.330826 Transcript_102520/m.330826 type:complete len:242 (+) Transcript_102520:484-1209(+)